MEILTEVKVTTVSLCYKTIHAKNMVHLSTMLSTLALNYIFKQFNKIEQPDLFVIYMT